jgi:hypothetical protein
MYKPYTYLNLIVTYFPTYLHMNPIFYIIGYQGDTK